MSASPEPSEQDLHDYVDGRLDGERRAAIADYLARHPQEAARIETYRAQMAGLHALYDDALGEPIPAAPRSSSRPARPRMRRCTAAWGARRRRSIAAGTASSTR